MKRLCRDSSVHPATVTAFSEGDVTLPRRPRRSPSPEPEVSVLQVHPGIWATALAAAGGDASRIRVISATKVEVV